MTKELKDQIDKAFQLFSAAAERFRLAQLHLYQATRTVHDAKAEYRAARNTVEALLKRIDDSF